MDVRTLPYFKAWAKHVPDPKLHFLTCKSNYIAVSLGGSSEILRGKNLADWEGRRSVSSQYRFGLRALGPLALHGLTQQTWPDACPLRCGTSQLPERFTCTLTSVRKNVGEERQVWTTCTYVWAGGAMAGLGVAQS